MEQTHLDQMEQLLSSPMDKPPAPYVMQDFDISKDEEISQLMKKNFSDLIAIGEGLYQSSSIAIEECFVLMNKFAPTDTCSNICSVCCCNSVSSETQTMAKSLEHARKDLQDECIRCKYVHDNPCFECYKDIMKVKLAQKIYNFKILQSRIEFRRNCLKAYCCSIGCALCCCLCNLR
jgi:hypothetical protein